MQKLPELIVRPDNGGGIKVSAVMGAKYNCVEFTLRDDVPQTVLESPWIQFMPADMRTDILNLAMEIVRRANAHEFLEQLVEEQRKNWHSINDDLEAERHKTMYYVCALAEIAQT